MQRIASSHAHEGEGADAGGAVTDRVAKAVLNPGHETERRKRAVALDPTYTPQLGLLEEMSLAELRERLLIVEEQREEEEAQAK